MDNQDIKNILHTIPVRKRPSEKSVINHNIRDKLGITSDEYVIIDLCSRMYTKNKKYTGIEMRDKIGYDIEFIKNTVKALIDKGFLVRISGEAPRTTDKWNKMFMVSEEEFVEFMAPMTFPSRIVKWTGSKVDSKDKYDKARKIYSSIYLLERKKAYFEFLSRELKRDIMAAAVFLNVKTRRFSEEWETYGIVIKPKVIENMPAVNKVSRKDLIGM